MTSITHLALRHRRLVALAWIILTVVGVLTVSSATGGLSHNFNTPGTAGYDANAHIIKSLGIDGNEQPTIAVLHLPAGEGMGTAAGQAAAARTFAAANRAGHVAVADYANTHNPKLISRDGQTTWALIDVPNPDVGPGQGVVDRIGPALRAAAPAGVSVSMTGFEQIQSNGGGGGGGPSVLLITVIGAIGALAVLLFVYASAIAIVPLLIAIPSILTTFLLVLGLEQAISVNFLVEYLVAVMGLGVAVDYSLLLITRWREERDAGRSNEDAILAAGPTAGRAVVLSGATVAVGLLSLVVLPVPFLRSIGLGWHADPARRDRRGRHAAAGDPRRVGPGARQAPRALELDHLQPPVGVLGQADRAPPLGRRRRWTRDRDRPRHPGAVDEHRPAAGELARRKRPAGPDPARPRAPGRAERRRVPDPGADARRPGRRSSARSRSRARHRASTPSLLPPPPRSGMATTRY